MGKSAIIEATSKLPDGHVVEGRYDDIQAASLAARDLLRGGCGGRLTYLTDKRGCWEVVSYPLARA